MNRGLALVTSRQWQRHKLRLVLTCSGIALGVAVFFAIQSTNSTLVDSLHTTIEKLAGKATIQLAGGDAGFPETYLKTVRATPGVELAEPVTETMASTGLDGDEKLLILGLDTGSDLAIYSEMFDDGALSVANSMAFTSRSDSIAVSRKFAQRHGFKDGDTLPVVTQSGPRVFTIRAMFRSVGAGEVFDGNVAVMDIYASQEMFGKTGRVDRIDLTNAAGVDVDQLQKRLSAELPAGIRAERPDRRGKSLENSVSSMHFGLTIMSFLAFMICAFLIFNSFSISVNQRWKEIGVLRAIGVTRTGIQLMFLAEAALIGVIGTLMGIAGGWFLAKAAIRIVISVSTTMYGFISSPKELEFNYAYAAQALAVGIVGSIIAAWLPSRAASRLDPVAALYNIETRPTETASGWPRAVLGAACVLIGIGLTAFTTAAVGVNFQLFYSLFLQIGMILLLPQIIRGGSMILRPLMHGIFGIEGLIAVETIIKSPRRTASTVGALMVGLSFVFSSGAFIISQKAALNRSLDKALDADILVTSSQQLQSSQYHFSPATTARLLAVPGIAAADTLRVGSVDYDGETVSVLAHDINAYFTISPDMLDSGDVAFARSSAASGTGMIISNNFALRWNVRIGDTVRLDTPGGTLSLPVVGMLDYYRSEKGTIFIDRSVYQRYWNDNDSDYILIDLKPGVSASVFKQQAAAAIAGQQNAFIYTHEEFKLWVGRLIDQFFTLMYLQMVVAIFVAALGLANTMIISVDERRHELGIFRAIGGIRRQVLKMVLLEAVAISLIGLMAGAVAGVFNAYFLVNTAAKVVAGFRVEMVFPYYMVFAALPCVVIVAVLAAAFPAVKAARLNVVDAIGYE